MDFLTALPYWGIIVIILLNTWLVSRMKITFQDEDKKNEKIDE